MVFLKSVQGLRKCLVWDVGKIIKNVGDGELQNPRFIFSVPVIAILL